MSKKVVLSGYYGFDNIGDEAVLYCVLQALRIKMPEAEVIVLSANPQKTEERYGVKAVNRWDKGAIYRTLKASDMLISGGGSLLQDVSSANSPLYYLGIMKLAQWLKKPVVVYAQGIGPLNLKRNRFLTKQIVGKAASITVRDRESMEELRAMGIHKIINVTADPVLTIAAHGVDKTPGRALLEELGFDFGKKTVMVSLRSWKDNSFVLQVAQCCDQLCREGWQVLLIPMQYTQDRYVLEQVQAAMQEKALFLNRQCEPLEMVSILSYSEVVLGMRLHALIMAVALNKATVGIVYDPKISSFLQSVGNENYQKWNETEAQQLAEMVKAECCAYRGMDHILERAIAPACFAANILQ